MDRDRVVKVVKNAPPYVLLIAMAVVFVLCLRIRIKAEDFGSDIGMAAGKFAGKIAGTVEGFTEGSIKGAEDGKNKGLSAEDTDVKIEKNMREVANLRVMVATVRLKNLHEVGDKYAALYLLKGKMVFSVDLSEAVVKTDDKYCYISIPLPKVDLVLDEDQIELIAEYQEKFFNGSAEDGYDAYINSMKQIDSKSEECVANYPELYERAKSTALEQVRELADAVTLNLTPKVSFMEEGDPINE